MIRGTGLNGAGCEQRGLSQPQLCQLHYWKSTRWCGFVEPPLWQCMCLTSGLSRAVGRRRCQWRGTSRNGHFQRHRECRFTGKGYNIVYFIIVVMAAARQVSPQENVVGLDAGLDVLFTLPEAESRYLGLVETPPCCCLFLVAGLDGVGCLRWNYYSATCDAM